MAAPDVSLKAGTKSDSADYRVGPQDLLEISVFQVPELSRTVRVNTGGEISLPLIGVVQAGGRTVQDVEHEIATKLSAGYMQDPQVSVFVKEFTSQRVTLEGALKKPGIYPLTGKTSLLQTIAMAGGLDEMADLQGVIVFRMIDGKKKAARFDLKQIRNGSAEDPAIYGDDIVVVEESNSKSMFSKILKSIPALGVFTFF
jgi:polysaccharide export outer membrane protein